MFDFNTPISRKDTHALKYTALRRLYGREDILPFWVADMEFAVAPAIIRTLEGRVGHPVYGYTSIPESLLDTICHWNEKRYGMKIGSRDISLIPGVMTGVSAAILALSKPGDAIVVQTPLYPPLLHTVTNTGRILIENRLIIKGERYCMDLDALEAVFSSRRPRLMVLCSPHNPVGRVWGQDELEKLVGLTVQYGVCLISDEIHADIVYSPHKHVSTLTVGDYGQKLIVMNSASKSFNVAGFNTAYALIPDKRLRTAFRQQLLNLNLHGVNIFGMVALESAYGEGEEWLEALLEYLVANRDFMTRVLNEELPHLGKYTPEGTCLYWLDFTTLGHPPEEIRMRLIDKARVGMNEGSTFCRHHQGFWRFNFGVPRSMLAEGLERIVRAFQ